MSTSMSLPGNNNNDTPCYGHTVARVFVASDHYSGWPAQGNPCVVNLLNQEPTSPSLPDTNNQAKVPYCASWPASDSAIHVRCWTENGELIQCCGHGLLASAAAQVVAAYRLPVTIYSNGSTMHCRQEEDRLWLDFPNINLSPCPVPDWWLELFSSAPESAALAGNDDGYMILQWPQETPLKNLQPPPVDLAKFTRRALIVSSRQKTAHSPHGEDIQFRYFAPQYGVIEDTATGSAMRILASYWQTQEGLNELKAYQCSATGGILYSRCNGKQISVGGNVQSSAINQGTLTP